MPEEQIRSASAARRRRDLDTSVVFGPFVLDRVERTLKRRGSEIALPERSLRLLEVLVRSAGRTVSRDRLVEEGWQGAYVSDTSLTEAMSRLRTALGDEAQEPTYIRTVHRRGYQFMAPIHSVGDRSGTGERFQRPVGAGFDGRIDSTHRGALGRLSSVRRASPPAGFLG